MISTGKGAAGRFLLKTHKRIAKALLHVGSSRDEANIIFILGSWLWELDKFNALSGRVYRWLVEGKSSLIGAIQIRPSLELCDQYRNTLHAVRGNGLVQNIVIRI
jgi:hypothetical protein